ncbi:MAG: putative manganese-dependent inorganic diphosphatase [Sporomusaceae bacterium]|nr:putative manganese-dependent inorganic diphosphatase [Sporomusaceae bacterium]
MIVAKPIYVMGHKNPDTDSICSAIAYAGLKQALGIDAIAARAGKVNNETKYILDKLGVKAPLLINDLYPRVREMMRPLQVTIHPDQTLKELGSLMKEHNVKSIPVIDNQGMLEGIVSVGDLARRYFEELEMPDLSEANVEFGAVVKVLDGTLLCGSALDQTIKGKLKIAAAKTETMVASVDAGDTVLVGDRLKAQLACIEKGVQCLIITGGATLAKPVAQAASDAKVMIISAPYDTYTCARLITQSVPVRTVMQSQVVTFKPSQLVMDIKGTIAATSFRNYPIVENGRFVGMIDRDKLILPEKEQVILVDHNELAQAVEGIHEGEIIEVVDHHRLGGLETSYPVDLHFEPVGCTATIVANMYWQNNVEISKETAGLLLSAILSDTVLFKSPTCTAKDRKTAEKLAEISGLDCEEHGLALLRAGSDTSSLTASDILKNDFKEFQMGDYRLAIGQISVLAGQEILAKQDDLKAAMKTLCDKEGYDMVLLMNTDILEEATYLFYEGQPISLIQDAFGSRGENGIVHLPGVMSRKKQIVPPLTDAARKI